MREIDQTIFLDQLESALEEQMKEVIAVFQNLPEEVLVRPGKNGGWSIAACMNHLNTYASFYMPRLERALETAQQKDGRPFKNSLLGHYFIRMMDVSRSKRKYKAMKIHRPGDVSKPYQVMADFIGHLERMHFLLGIARAKGLRKSRIPTSISPLIKLNAGDTFAFLLTHNRRHLEQAKLNLV